jgi:hypothetical protein
VFLQNFIQFIQTAYRTQQLKRGFTEYEIRQQLKKYLLSLPRNNNNVHIYRNLSNKELTKILDVLLPKIIKTLGNGSIPNIIIPIRPIIPIIPIPNTRSVSNKSGNNPGNKKSNNSDKKV